MIWNKEAREASAHGRFEIMCEMYINGSDEAKEIFLKGCGLYHLFTDPAFFNATQIALAEQLHEEFNGRVYPYVMTAEEYLERLKQFYAE